MSEAWFNFAVLIFVQLLLFVVLAYHKKKLSSVKNLLGKGVLIGVVFGLSFDFVFGRLLGLASYELGFGALFMLANAALSYGLWSATMVLFQEARLLSLFGWSFFVMAIYEITNLFFRVWTWEFSLPPILFLVVLATGYFAGSVLVAIVAQKFSKYQKIK